MIVGEKIIELVIKAVAKKFKLTKILEYVEKPNELDEAVARLENRIELIESLIKTTPRNKKWYEK